MTGRTRDAGWQIGVSKTVDHSVDDLWSFLVSAEGTAIWLGEGVTVRPEPGSPYETTAGVRGETRSFSGAPPERRRVRLTWQPPDWSHDTTIQLSVTEAANGRARLGVHQERLADAGEREQQRKHWQNVINALLTAIPK
jgi:uncharacterized protein YndB with AHSA1/START domain